MLKPHNVVISAALLVATVFTAAFTHADDTTTKPATGFVPKIYFSLGGLKLDTDPAQLDGSTYQVDKGFLIGGGGLRALPYANSYWDWSLLIGGNEENIDSGTCVTTNGDYVGCNYAVTTVVAALPVTANMYYPINDKLKVSAGLGGSITMLYFDAGLEADGYQSKGTDTTSSITITPVLQAAITYDRVQFKILQQMSIGNSETGKGSATFFTLNWLNK
jgi:hypothetical protein